VALAATTRVTSTVAGYAAAGNARSGSASASAPTVVGVPSTSRRARASPVATQKRSSEVCAASGVVAVMVRHQRPHTYRTDDSTLPLRLPRRGGHGSITAA
jgi:hypothetical protein